MSKMMIFFRCWYCHFSQAHTTSITRRCWCFHQYRKLCKLTNLFLH